MARAFMHRFEQSFQRLGKGLVAFGTTQPPRFFEIRLRKAAAGALDLRAAGSLFDFLRGAKAQEQISERKTGGIIDPFGFGALFAEIDLLHFVPCDLG